MRMCCQPRKGGFTPNEQRARTRARAFFSCKQMLFQEFTPKYQEARIRTKN